MSPLSNECPICEGCGRLKFAGRHANRGQTTPFEVTCWGCGGAGSVDFNGVNTSVVNGVSVETVEAIKADVFGKAPSPTKVFGTAPKKETPVAQGTV